ncbi:MULTISPECIES: DJ-1 family glyoxalase III [unclassified Campylobacter]|uniref:DJ-1 family glyoxalase III n=1 Tax=unclassified Campylobacter TaxID=2593542 RepID=UPI003D33FF0A
MKKVVLFLADGFEEIEALSVVDILRRAEISIVCVSLDDSELVRGAHDIYVKSELSFSQFNPNEFDVIILPGGLPGAFNLAKNTRLLEVLREFDKANKMIAAICAAPMVLAEAGVLKTKFTCYPGFESNIKCENTSYTAEANVVKDANIITSCGPATAMEFALFLVKELCGDEKFKSLKSDLLFKN